MAKKSIHPKWQSILSRIEARKITASFRTIIIAARVFGYSPKEMMAFAQAPYTEPTTMNKAGQSEIGEIVQARRESLDMFCREIGERVGFTKRGIQYLERKYPKNIQANTAIALDKALGFDGVLIGLTWSFVERELAEKYETH